MTVSIQPQDALAHLHALRSKTGEMDTVGLSDEVISSFCVHDPKLGMAIVEATAKFENIIQEFGTELLQHDEASLVKDLQHDFVNFYAPATVNPYIALAGRGPWIVTAYGAVVHDNGGYGMLGAGHGPSDVIDAMSGNWVMANVMTPSFSQPKFFDYSPFFQVFSANGNLICFSIIFLVLSKR